MRSCACVVAAPRPISCVDALHLALGELLAGPQLLELRARLPVVEAREHVALGHGLALAVAHLDDAIADQARHLGPAHRLDRARRVDDLDSRAARRRHGGDLRTAAKAPPQQPRRQAPAPRQRRQAAGSGRTPPAVAATQALEAVLAPFVLSWSNGFCMRLNPRPGLLLSGYVLRRFGAKVDGARASAPIFSTATGCGTLTSVKPRPAAICLGAPKQN